MNSAAVILGIVGSIASIVAFFLAFVTFVNPMRRIRWTMLRRPSKWVQKYIEDGASAQWVYEPNPGFQLLMGKILVKPFKERWIPKLPDKENDFSFKLYIVANGAKIHYENFVCIDGARYTVPMPRQDKNNYFYDKLQLQLARVVGNFPTPRWENIEDFAKNNNIELRK